MEGDLAPLSEIIETLYEQISARGGERLPQQSEAAGQQISSRVFAPLTSGDAIGEEDDAEFLDAIRAYLEEEEECD